MGEPQGHLAARRGHGSLLQPFAARALAWPHVCLRAKLCLVSSRFAPVHASLVIAFLAVVLFPSAVFAQAPELSLRELASGQIKKGMRAIGFGGDGATVGNYALVYRDAGGALVDGGLTHYTNGNDFTFTAVGVTTPALWHGLAVYAIALSQHAEDIHLALSSPGLGTAARPLVGGGTNQALFIKAAMPLARGFSAGALLSYELSQFDAASPPGDASPASVHYATRWRPSGGFGVTWEPSKRLLFGTRAILNHDQEVRTDSAGTSEALARSYEARLGGAASPWTGGLIDVGGTWLYRRNGLAGTTKTALHPNLGFEQSLLAGAFALRAGVDETSYGGGFSLRRRPLKLDVAYVYDLGRARVGDLFGKTSNSLLATLTFDMTWLGAPPAPAPEAGQPASPAGANQHP